MRAVIVGPGVIGELMGKAWREVLPEGELVFLGKEGERARFLAERYGGRAAYAVVETSPGDWVFLTLEPQTAVRVLPTLRPLRLPHSVVLSVMTGISLAYLRKALDHGRLVEYTGANRCRSLRMQGRGPDRP